jgi:glycosyltransferase involved in cell wall biosynthesis
MDLIEDGTNGLLYEYGDVEAFARQVTHLMADASLRQTLSAVARPSVEAYRLETVLPVVMDRYLSAVDGSSLWTELSDRRRPMNGQDASR